MNVQYRYQTSRYIVVHSLPLKVHVCTWFNNDMQFIRHIMSLPKKRVAMYRKHKNSTYTVAIFS